MSDCSTIKPLLGSYLDDELEPGRRAAIAEHLKDCPDCARELDELGRVDQIAREAEAPRLTHDERKRLWGNVRRAFEAAPAVMPSRGARPWLRPLKAAAIAAMVLIAVGLVVMLYPANGTSPGPAWEVASYESDSPDVDVHYFYDADADVVAIWAVSEPDDNGDDDNGARN